MDLWTEDKNMSKTFDVDSVSWWKSFIITIPLLQLAPLITPPPRLQSVCVFSSNDSQRLHMRAAQSQISSDSDLLAPNRVNSTMKSAGPER